MYRKNRNAPPFDHISLPMQDRTIKKLCRDFGIRIPGIQFKVQRDTSLLDICMTGSADYDHIGRIDLFPNAFKSQEELVKTILHETAHVKQLQKYGKDYVQAHLPQMEAVAYKFEAFYYHVKRGNRK